MGDEENKSIKAKDASLFGQIIAAVWIGGWDAFQFTRQIITGVKVDASDIIITGLAIAACFSPVYVSILFDKIKDIKLGGTK